MTDGVKFDEDAVAAVERIYTTTSMAERRQRIRDALALTPGERVLSVGTGPGFETRGLAEDVGEDGIVHGIDAEEAMLAVARERCDDQPWVTFERGDAADLPIDDGTFDAAAAVQVYEYVPNLDTAFAELHRALVPGGRAVVFDSDWSTMVYNTTDENRSDRVVSAFDTHCPHPYIARTLKPRLERAGFEVTHEDAYVHFETELSEDSVGAGFIPVIEAFVSHHDDIDGDEVSAWADDVRARAEAGEFFFSLNQYLFVAEKPHEG